ncbi:Ultraviolet-B receptor UVR8-like [Oopsacas minuta]|uniref:Ultraviolet-B receptor UVR8-like n=1 Tax=Oopsacas minuta TaxID=111878 RepID=A0AAV7KE34_9METZ|nr:Ultraviolet-B receptor UVR8-like [Oopsacas minuta]
MQTELPRTEPCYISRLPCEVWLNILSSHGLSSRDLVAVENTSIFFRIPQKLFNGASITEESARVAITLDFKRFGQFCSKREGFESWKHVLNLVEQLNHTSRKLASGAFQNLFVTPNSQLLSWGAGKLGQLGNGKREDNNNVSDITRSFLPPAERIVHVSAGLAHGMVVTDSGSVYAIGDGRYYQTGMGNKAVLLNPLIVTPIHQHHVIQTSCGGSHSLFLTDMGDVYSVGYGEQGQLGLGLGANTGSTSIPKKIELMDNSVIISISSTVTHNILLTLQGSVYAFGLRVEGMLGIETSMSTAGPHITDSVAFKPVKIPNLENIREVTACPGRSICIDKRGRVYTFGTCRKGSLGHGDTRPQKTPKIVEALLEYKIAHAFGGALVSIFLTDEGHPFWCGYGMGEMYEFPTCLPTCIRVPEKIIGASIGDSHILLLSQNNNIYSVGMNTRGQTGHDISIQKIDKFTRFHYS